MPSCGAYLRGDVIHPYARTTTSGMNIFHEPVEVLALADRERLGQLLRRMLQAPAEMVPHPATWSGLCKPLFKAAGVRSKASFVKVAKYVSLRNDDGQITLFPTVNERRGGAPAYFPLTEKIRTIHIESPGLEDELFEAFDDSMSLQDVSSSSADRARVRR